LDWGVSVFSPEGEPFARLGGMGEETWQNGVGDNIVAERKWGYEKTEKKITATHTGLAGSLLQKKERGGDRQEGGEGGRVTLRLGKLRKRRQRARAHGSPNSRVGGGATQMSLSSVSPIKPERGGGGLQGGGTSR